MTEEQKKAIEVQLNHISCTYAEREAEGRDIVVAQERFASIATVVNILGYKVEEDGKGTFLGIEFKKYKIVESK